MPAATSSRPLGDHHGQLTVEAGLAKSGREFSGRHGLVVSMGAAQQPTQHVFGSDDDEGEWPSAYGGRGPSGVDSGGALGK